MELKEPTQAWAGALSDDGCMGALGQLGHAGFRPGQREALGALMDKGRLLLVAPTGGGKSLVYQLPALIFPGTTLVISPLISLMHDQVESLTARGIPAAYLASTLPAEEQQERLRRMAAGKYRLIYAAPERLTVPRFREALRHLDCPLVAVDEAHCISEWGHDFRPEYMQIGALLAELPASRILACTATATPVVRDEIVARLGLGADTPQIVSGFARPNLALRVRETASRREREGAVDSLLKEALGDATAAAGTAIIYCPTRKATEEEARRLADAGWSALPYHAGLAGEVREKVQKDFGDGACRVVVATNAFGMGIDRPDVRAVAHLAPPGSIEAYYQEVGRAGRDGRDSVCLLLVSPGDLPLRRRLIERAPQGTGPSPRPELLQHKWSLFLELMRWAEGGSCRHDAILRYFGDEAETLSGCGRCDVCLQMASEAEQDPGEVEVIVRKALSAVARMGGRFGIQVAAGLLRGDSRDERLVWSGLDRTPTFGSLSERSQEWLLRLLRRCVTAGWVDFTGGDRPLVRLTEEGVAVMTGRMPVRLLLPPRKRPGAQKVASSSGAAAGGRAPAADGMELDEEEQATFERLRRHRLEIARSEGVPPYVVATDRTLRDIAHLRPADLDELKLAHGIGPSRADRYGAGFLAVLREDLPLPAADDDMAEQRPGEGHPPVQPAV